MQAIHKKQVASSVLSIGALLFLPIALASGLSAQAGAKTQGTRTVQKAKEVPPAKSTQAAKKKQGGLLDRLRRRMQGGSARGTQARGGQARGTQARGQGSRGRRGNTRAAPKENITIYGSREGLAGEIPWRSIGPANHSGRILDIAVDPRDSNVWYIASASGGVWKTTNHGLKFTQVFGAQGAFSIGDIAIDPSHPDTIWVGTGEANNQRSSYWGDGIWRSDDGGKTWKNMGLPDSHHIGRVIVDPTDSKRVFAAVAGHLYTSNKERGLYRTTDGGKTWKRVLGINDKVGVIDVAMQPGNPEVLLASSYERLRRAHHFDGAGQGSALYRSEDGGKSWKRLRAGLPGGEIGRIGVEFSRSNPKIAYASVSNQNTRKATQRRSLEPGQEGAASGADASEEEIEAWAHEKMAEWDAPRFGDDPGEQAGRRRSRGPRQIGGEVYKSIDGGKTWKKTNRQSVGGTPAYYYGQIRIDPSDPQRVYVLSVPLYVSKNGGKSFRRDGANRIHVDHHALWIDPKDGEHLLLGNDGGLFESWDRGKNWQHFENLPVGQYYAIGVDMAHPYRVFGGTQDNGSWAIPSKGPTSRGIRIQDVFKVAGGDGFYCVPDPSDPNIVYAESQFGGLVRQDLRSMRARYIKPRPKKGETPYRFNWMSPVVVSHYNPQTIYFGGNKLFKSVNRGDNWISISGDLTTQDPVKLKGNVPHCTITSISESKLRPGLLWVGTDDGKLWMTVNDGREWRELTARLPKAVQGLWVSRVEASQFQEGRCYVSYTGYREDHFEPYVFVTDDYGLSFREISGDLPGQFPVNVVREDPRNEDLLFVGTESGTYVSFSRGGNWVKLGKGMANCAVHDLVIHPRDPELVIGTHGLGIFIADIAALEQWQDKTIAKGSSLFRPSVSWRFPRGADTGYTRPSRESTFSNPRSGADLCAWIAPGTKKARLVIRDVRGSELKAFDLPAESGLHVVSWLGGGKSTGGRSRSGMFQRFARRFSRGSGRPLAKGHYRLELDCDGKIQAQSLEVR